MKKMCISSVLLIFTASVVYSAPKSEEIENSTATVVKVNSSQKNSNLGARIEKINKISIFQKEGNRESLQEFAGKMQKNIGDIDVDEDLIKAARDKSLDWKTRYILIEHAAFGDRKNISKDEELGLYSEALLDNQEHDEVRKLAAQSLMEPARSEVKAREALAKAAKDKSLPGPVLWSVMVSVGSSGIDDVDTLAGLMGREPKTNNEIGINLNAVRALGNSNDPRAVGMLFKILDESEPSSFFNVTALEQFSVMIKDPEKETQIHPILAPRLIKLLHDRGSHIGASRWLAGRILVRMHERSAIGPIMKWLKPRDAGGGWSTDVAWAAEILAEFHAKEAIPELQKVVDNFEKDPRWADLKRISLRGQLKFPDEFIQYQKLRECLRKLKGENYDKSRVTLPWDH